MFKLLLSSSTEHFEDEQFWLLDTLAIGLITPQDMAVVNKRCGGGGGESRIWES